MLVYPETHAFPLEAISWEVVRRLERKSFDVPDIKVSWKDEWDLSRLLVRGQDFVLLFCSPSNSSDPMSLLRVATPEKEFEFWSGDHELSLAVYAYTDWERDRDWFLSTTFSKHHGMRNGAPRYLRYSSKCDCSDLDNAVFEGGIAPLVDFMSGKGTLPPQHTLHTHRDRWSCPLMVWGNHYGTEYEPIAGEPTVYRTDEVMEEMRRWLETWLLPTI